ncbi:MAG: hypothetical protein Q8O99_01660 [bacterium]|nr:hypothetical protein [bacterium]
MRTNKFNSAGKLNSDHIISMRESFSGIINTFGGTLHAASGPERGFMVKLLYNKFLQYFGEDLKKDSKDALKKALQEGNITKIREIIDIDLLAIKTRTDNKGEQQILREGKTEGVVQDTLHTYGDLLAKAIKDIPE